MSNTIFLILLILPEAISAVEEQYQGYNFHSPLIHHCSDIPMMKKRFAYVRQRLNAMNRYMDQIYNHSPQVISSGLVYNSNI